MAMEQNKLKREKNKPKDICDKPSPYDFIEFLPWACKQYGVNVIVHSIIINETKQSFTRKIKQKAPKPVAARDKKPSSSSCSSLNILEDAIHDEISTVVMAFFDHTHSLISIKIEKSEKVSRIVFQIIALIIEFYPSLTSLSADKGLDAYCIYEITKILPISSITDISLDGTCLKNPNYHILLETVSNLNCLSLAGCQITDEMIKRIAENLTHLHPAAKTLIFLNFTSNRITDTGAAHLADALKTNRRLAYLNLSDNCITDTGASHIFDIMLAFPIPSEDLKQTKIRRREYIIEKTKLFHKFATELKITEDKKLGKRKARGSIARGRTNRQTETDQYKNKKTEEWTMDKVASLKLLAEVKVTINLDKKFFDRAENLAFNAIGPFEDPFEGLFVKDEKAYCTGNNNLTCLNLAFNNLTYSSLQKLFEVLNYQKHKQQTPRGLFRVRLEGNYLPTTCKEYTEINELLDLALETSSKQMIKTPMRMTLRK